MPLTAELAERLRLPQYPRSAAYDPDWALANLMGPNALWLTEALASVMDLRPGMRVLDLGCGKALSSIFLAREFDVQVWATDLWISANENWGRIQAAGVADRVFPIHAEAHNLPFAKGFFDAAVSLDAYHYFGTADLYIATYAQLVKPGGQLGIVVPGLRAEFLGDVPAHLAPHWDWEFATFHSPEWWSRHWARTGQVTVEHADVVPDGWREWALWLEVCRDAGYHYSPSDLALLEADAGEHFAFSRILARRPLP
ncbi:MAG TPA: methyltransferase domain-containing protein [Anaerolineales bacterium]|nr:methyltransferase domain-containing protein [Anaerolineales bacterium]HRF47153.1 methyltransferase domain-containing protein [Anaerolineales bacterium]